MKLSIFPLALTCTGLLASASPLRVIIVSSSIQAPDNGPVAHLQPPHLTLEANNGVITKQRAPCGARLRQKASSFSEAFKIALGFGKSNKPEADVKHFTPVPFIGTPHIVEGTKGKDGEYMRIFNEPARQRHGHHHHRLHQSGRHSFLMRVHFALMSLGPWEGRAVAFVLGCGIGVLLRMFWVMMVVSYRMIKGQRSPSEQEEHEYTVIDLDAEEIFVAPPQYTFPIEKVEIAEPVAVPAEAK